MMTWTAMRLTRFKETLVDLETKAFLDGLKDRLVGYPNNIYIGTPFMASYLEGWDFGSI